MSHSVFQTAQIMLINTQTLPTTKTISSIPPIQIPGYQLHPVPVKLHKVLFVKASSSSPPVEAIDEDTIAGLERCFRASPLFDSSSSSLLSGSYGTVMKKEYGAFGAVTLEKVKLNLTKKQTSYSPEERARREKEELERLLEENRS